MKTMKMTILAMLSLMAIATAAAQNIDTVILATDINTPDLYASNAASYSEGLPVLVTENGTLTQDIKDEMESLGVTQVIIVGGPVAISTEVEDELKDLGYEVTRLAGITATGTAVEVAEHFFPGELRCAVLAEHSANPDEDWEEQLEASNLAKQEGCPFIPVPEDDVPASVLEFLGDRNITQIRYIGNQIRSEVRNRLSDFNLTEFVGNASRIREEVRNRLENRIREETGDAPDLVVIAAPFWNSSLSLGARPGENSVVWRISSTDEVQDLIDYINDNNLTSVKVQGVPWLASEITSLLEDAGVTVTSYSAENASDVAKQVLSTVRNAWHNRMSEVSSERLVQTARIRNRLRERINDTQMKLNALETELESMAAEGEDVSAINASLQQAIARMNTAENYITSDWKRARFLVSKTVKEVLVRAWENNVQGRLLNISERIQEETQGISQALARVRTTEQEMRQILSSLRQDCNSDAVEDLVNRARSIRDDMETHISSGNYTGAAQASENAQELLRMARSLRVICQRRGAISSALQNRVRTTTSIVNNTLVSSLGQMG